MKISKKFFAAVILAVGLVAVNWETSRAETINEGFDSFNVGYDSSWKVLLTLPDGWDSYGTFSTIEKSNDTYHNKKPAIYISGTNSSSYLITPMLQGEFSFWLRNSTKNYQAYVKAVECTFDGGVLQLGEEIDKTTLPKVSSPSWNQVKFTANKPTRVALLMERCYFDDFTYTEAEAAEGPSLSIAGYPSGSTYDFGGSPVPEGTDVTFVLNNIGGGDLTVTSITVTGDYTVSEGSDITSIPANGKTSLTVKTPAKDTSGVLTVESNDAETPYTISLSSRYKVPMPIIGVSMSSIDFGKVTETVDQTVRVSNTGDADLIASVTSSEDSFTVDNTSLNVQPGGSVDLKVTFNYNTEAFGEHTGVVKITPESGAAVDINVTAFAKDPTLWEEDFEKREIPQYWSTTGWTVTLVGYGGNGTYMAYGGTSSTPPTLTTPRLQATKGEALTFEIGGGTDDKTPMTVEYSHDQQTWIPLDESPVTSIGYKKFVAPEDGYYYLRFCGAYGAVDNFSGFRLALKEHDLSLVGQNIPATAHQYSPYTASVTVKEMMGREESATVALWVNSVKVAETEDVELQANEEKAVALTYTPTETAQNVEAVIIVNYSDETLASAPVMISIVEAPALDENLESALETTTHPSLVLKYTPVNGWNTIAVPFTLTPEILEEIFGKGFEIFEFREFNGSELVFKEPAFIAAGYPYIVRAIEVPASDQGIILHDVKIETQTPREDEHGGVAFSASFSPLGIDEMDGCYAVSAETPVLTKASDIDVAPGFRGYVTLPAGTKEVPGLLIHTRDGVVTGLSDVLREDVSSDAVYDMQGRVVSRPLAPGLYIINGKKIIVR